MANAANLISGRASRNVLAPVVGDVWGSRIAFAGRFVESQIETVANAILTGGVEGDVARRALGRLALGGAVATFAINEALGNETEWNPIKDGRLNSNWMRIRAGGKDISLFGPWDSLAKGAISTIQGDPLFFIQGKLAPAASLAVSAYRGENAIGKSFEINPVTKDFYDPSNLAQMAPFPFGLRDVVRDARTTDWSDPASILRFWASTGEALAGIKAAPLTSHEVYAETLSKAFEEYRAGGQARGEKPDDDPLFKRRYAAEHPDEVPKATSDASVALAAAEAFYQPQLDEIDRLAMGDELTIGEWRDERSSKMDERRGARRIAEEKLQEFFGDKKPTPGTGAAWVDSYYAIWDAPGVVDPASGIIDRDLFDYLKSVWLEENGPEALKYLNDYGLAATNTEIEAKYLAAVQQLSKDGYWPGSPTALPRYIGMTSGLSDQKISAAARQVSMLANNDPKYALFKDADFATKAFVVLKPLGFSMAQILDVANANKDSYVNPKFALYKLRHPELTAWLNDDITYSTILAIEAAKP